MLITRATLGDAHRRRCRLVYCLFTYQVVVDALVELPLSRAALPELLIAVIQALPVLAELCQAVGVDVGDAVSWSVQHNRHHGYEAGQQCKVSTPVCHRIGHDFREHSNCHPLYGTYTL